MKENSANELKPLVIEGETYYTQYTKKFENRRNWTEPDVKQIISFIPGTVRVMSVKAGDTVKKDDSLMVLEAMKMMNTIYAPVSGKIKSVNVNIGDKIPKGLVMIEME